MRPVHDLPGLHARFVASEVPFGGDGPPTYELWQWILTHYPEMARRKLYDQLDDLYVRAYASTIAPVIAMGHDLSRMQIRFLEMLDENGIGFAHVVDYRLWCAIQWRDRIEDKITAMGPKTKIKRGVPVLVEPLGEVKHTWLN